MMDAMSPTVLVSISSPTTNPNMARIATNEEGMALLSLGSPQIISMVVTTNPSIM